MDNQIAALEVRLLLLKYGYDKVIYSLSNITNDSIDKIEFDIKTLKSKVNNKPKPKRKIKKAEELIDRIIQESPSKSNELKALAIKYDNKTFLPQMKDVKRFLDKNSRNPRTYKSRSLAATSIFTTLASFSIPQLQEYLQVSELNNQNSLSILSDQIIGNRGKIH